MSLSAAYLKQQGNTPHAYAKGAYCAKEGLAHILSDTQSPEGYRTVKGQVQGSESSPYQATFTLSPKGDRILRCNCDCLAFSNYDGLCKHLIALALTHNATQPAVPATDSAALHMLRQYAQRIVLDAPPTTTGVQLVPTLELTALVPKLSFKIGQERLYVLKRLDEFLAAVKSGAFYSYGKNFSFSHSLSAFDPESAHLVQFLQTYYDENNFYYAKNSYYYGGQERARWMQLPPFMLDQFLELFQGRSLAITQKSGTALYTVTPGNPSLHLQLDRKKNGGYRLSIGGDFFLVGRGAQLYLGVGSVLYRCDKGFSDAARALLTAIAQSKDKALFVAPEDMPLLSSTLLPALERYLPIASDENLDAFRPPALESKLYLDMPSPQVVTARLEHHYGAHCHPGFQDKNIRQSLDLKGEVALENLLLRYFQEEGEAGALFIREDEEALYALAEHGLTELGALAEVLATDAFKSLRVKPSATVSVGVRMESDLLRLHFDVAGIDLAELEQVLASYRKAKKYHRLRDGSFLSLENSSLAEFSQLAQGLDLTGKEILSGELSLPKYRALYLDALLKQSQRLQYDRDGGFKQMIRDVRDVSDADYPIPSSLRSVLRNYQKTGYRWLRTLAAYGFGGILADDMGLGKTLQVIALLLAQKEQQSAQTVSIVVCPSSLVLNWESEVRKFAPALSSVPVTGSAANREALIQEGAGRTDLFITSYDSLKRDVALYEALSFQYVIADEAQYMKNQNTQNAKAVKALRSVARLALTGTPVENSLAEVWSIFDFLMPGYLYHYQKFRKQFETPIVKQRDEAAAESLRKLVSPFLLRRMKRDVLKELPEKMESVLYAELEGEQQKLYLASALSARAELEAGLGDAATDKLQILALLTRLRQICCDPALVYENYEGASAKTELCMELLQRCIESGHRVLLFSQFTTLLRRIAQRLDAEDIPYFTITGETPVGQRLTLVTDFNRGCVPIFLISLKAGGTGLNLTGADVVIHYDPWWNSSAQNQASDRAHRIGQTKTVQVYKLIAKNTLEERILEMQKNKADLADMIVKEGDGGLARMSKSDLLALFT